MEPRAAGPGAVRRAVRPRPVLPRSLRARVTVLAALVSLVLLATSALAMVLLLRWQLTDNLDEALRQRADAIAAALAGGSSPADLGDEELLVQVVRSTDATVVEASAAVGAHAAIAPTTPGIRTVPNVAGRPGALRVLTRSLERGGIGEAQTALIIGVNADDVSDPVNILARLLAGAVPTIVAALAALTWWTTGRTLRPVEAIRAELADITARRLDRRVPEPPTGDEIARLARTTNQTLDRLEDSVRRQQRFVADASHELRGPLTRIRTELEVDLARPSAADPLATERSVLEETVQLQRLVEGLLLLARSDAAQTAPPDAPVDLDDIAGREARRLRERGHVAVDTTRVGPALVSGDRAQLARAVRNLLDNAERHARSTVALTLTETDASATLTVQDDGTGVEPDEAAHIFDRFTRLDEARARDGGGAGLGLAIAREIVHAHGGSLDLLPGTPTRFVLSLPRRVE